MKGYWVIPVLASVLILGIISLQQVYAPDNDKPEKIKVGPIKWSADTKKFEVSISVQCGIAKAAERADFAIETELVVESSSGAKEVLLVGSKVKEVVRSAECKNGADAVDGIQLVEFLNVNNFAGQEVLVTVTSMLLNPSGKRMGEEVTRTASFSELVPSACGDGVCSDDEDVSSCSEDCVISCESDRDCPEGSSCVFGLCVSDNTPVPESCEDDSDCPSGLNCEFGVCLPF